MATGALGDSSGFSSNSPDRAGSRLVIVHDSRATDTFNPDSEVVYDMVRKGLRVWTGEADVKTAWRGLISSNPVIGIKVNAACGPVAGTRPAVAEAVIKTLLDAGYSATNIIVWDKWIADLERAGYRSMTDKYGVRLAGAVEAGYDESVFYENSFMGKLAWGDMEFKQNEEGTSRKSFVTKLLSNEITDIINVTSLLNHYRAGVDGNLTGLALSAVDNTERFTGSPERLATAVPEIMAMREVGDKIVFNIVDALICQYEGNSRELLHYSAVLNQLRFGTDPVALDVISALEIRRRRRAADMKIYGGHDKLYENAELLQLGRSTINDMRIEYVDTTGNAGS